MGKQSFVHFAPLNLPMLADLLGWILFKLHFGQKHTKVTQLRHPQLFDTLYKK
jgi:hypothetical protein